MDVLKQIYLQLNCNVKKGKERAIFLYADDEQFPFWKAQL
jgi:hypothetical protein